MGTITDDDPMPALSIGDVAVTEGDAGTTDATFTVSLDAPSGRPSAPATQPPRARRPRRPTSAATGTVNFAAGEDARTITVAVNGDLTDEIDETFAVNLSAPVNATITDAEGAGTITDDDAPPSLSVSDVSVTEGNGSAVSAVFTVSLSSASGKTVNVDHATADGTATAPADYAAGTGSLTFTPGQTNKTVTVIVAGDSLDEIDETFTLNLSNAVNATIADGSGLGTILDNDALPIASVNDVTVTEGDTGPSTRTSRSASTRRAGGRSRSTTRLRTTRPPHRRTTRR